MPRPFQIFLFFFLFSGSLSFSQTLNGIVKDSETKEPLRGVHIISSGIQHNTISDETGRFSLLLKKGYSANDSISFSSVGYTFRRISLGDLKEMQNEILLTPAVDELKEVSLHSERKLNKKIQYSKLASMTKGAYSFGSTRVGDKIYVIGGDASRHEEPIKNEMARVLADRSISEVLSSALPDFSWPQYLEEVQVYDLAKDEWNVLPTTVTRRADHNVIFYKNRIYIFGGKFLDRSGQKVFLSHEVEVLDLKTGAVIVDPVNPHQAVGSAAIEHNGDLLIMGGSTRINKRRLKTFTDAVHLFNFETGLWFNAGKLPGKKETTGVMVDKKFYLVGGYDGNWLDIIESLDLSTGKWHQEAKLPSAIKDPSVASQEGIIYIYERGKIHVFDTSLAEMRTYLIDLEVEGPDLHIYNNQLFLLGGYYQHEYTRTPYADCFKIELEEFDKTEVLRRTTF